MRGSFPLSRSLCKIVAAADDELLFRRVFRVRGQPPDRYRKPPYTEVRVDLARYAGGTADLILRTTRRGKVLVQPLEQRGFGTAWEDPRLVPGPAAGS